MFKIQLRGHCQRCGREQAVKNGTMAHHGYTVRDGWFQGVCSGRSFQPVEFSRATLDKTVEAVRAQCVELRAQAEALTDQANWPETITIYDRTIRQDKKVPLASFSELKQREHINNLKLQLKNRAYMGDNHCDKLLATADKFHGRPLIEIRK